MQRVNQTRRRTRKPPPDYLSRSVQQRLLVLVGMLLLVLIMMQQAGKPQTWAWMWGNSQIGVESGAPVHSGSEAEIDRDSADQVRGGTGLQSTLESPPNLELWHPDLRPTLLEGVKDNSYFRREEHDVWFHLLDILAKRSHADLARYSLGPVSFLQLDRQTEVYRGRLVDLEGKLSRAHRVTAPANENGINSYWQCWLFLRDARRPIVLYALDLPAEFEGGMDLRREVRATGFVYKRWTYQSAEELTVAPVIMAKGLEFVQTSISTERDQSATNTAASHLSRLTWLVLTTSIAAAITVGALYRFSAGPKIENSDESIVIQIPQNPSDGDAC